MTGLLNATAVPQITGTKVANVDPLGLFHSNAPDAVTSTGYTPNNATASTVGQTSNADAVKALSQGYTASQINVSPESTSQFQLNKMLSSESPLMQQADTAGLQQANRRGLLNSSMAIGAAQGEMIRAATPFAQQDANTHANAGTFNAGALNAASQFGASAGNTAALQNAQLGTNVNQSNAAADNSNKQLQAQLGTNVSLANAQAGNAASQFGANASNTAALQSVDNTLKVQLADIQANTSMSIADRQLATQRAIADANNGVNVAIANGDNTTKSVLNAADNAARLGLAEMDRDTKIAIANMNKDMQISMAETAEKHKQLLQTNISAASAYQQYATNLANISTNTNMDQAAKNKAAQNQLVALRAGLDAFGEVSDLNLGKYFPDDTLIPEPAAAPAPSAAPAPTATPEPWNGWR